MSRVFLTFVILCVATIFITGIPLAKYLSNRYLELRRELNSEDAFKYSSRENSVPAAAKLGSQNGNPQSHEGIKEAIAPEFHTVSPGTIAKPLQVPGKIKKRSKRQEPEQNKEILSWNFNLIVTRYQNHTSLEKRKDVLDAPLEKSIDVALHTQGKAEKQTALTELQDTLTYARSYVKSMFSNKGESDRSEEIMNKNPFVHFKNGSSTETDADKQNVDAEFGTENETSLHKGREPKFLGFLGFGNRPQKTTQLPQQESTQLPEQEITHLPEKVIVSTENESSIGFRKNEELAKNESSLETEFVTENWQKGIFHPESLVSETTSSTIFEEMDNMSQISFQGLTEQSNCSDCATKKSELPDLKKITEKEGSETTTNTEVLFTDEVLEKFCMSLVEKLEESQPEDDFDPELNPTNDNRLRSSQNLSILRMLELYNSIKEKESTPDSAVIEDAFLVSDTSDSQPLPVSQRQSRFLGFNIFGFGSGRSAIVDDKPEDSISEELNGNIDMENLPSILDCENYFRKKQSMFPKPNLMDMMSDPKIQLTDFSNATISTKLKEQQLQFLTGLLKTSLNNSVETFDNSAEGKTEESGEKHFSHAKEEFLDENNETLAETESLLDKLTKTSTSSENEHNGATQTQRDARFFSVFGFGSGNNEDSRSDSDIFLDSGGSGGRFLETDSTTKLERNAEFGSGEAFQANTALLPEDLLEPSTSSEQRLFLGFMGFGGSGDGRELSESVETVPNEFTSCNESECIDDCSDGIPCIYEEPDDCNDCNIENFQDNLELTNITKNESECNDCNEIIYDDDKLVKISLNTEPTKSDKNLTAENFHDGFEDCSCFRNHSDESANFLECDKCNSDEKDLPDSYDIDENYQIEGSSGVANRTKSTENHVNECDDCGYNSDISSTKATESDQENSFFDCEDCNFSFINDSDGGYQSEEIPGFANETKVGEGNVNECDDCNYETEMNNSKTDFDKEISFLESDTSIEYHENTNETFPDGKIDSECDDCNLDIIDSPKEFLSSEDENFTSVEENYPATQPLSEVQNPLDHKTTEKIPRFMGPIFLTGSGDGNLFGGDDGPINLVEEEFTIAAPAFPRRRARLDDIEDDPCEDCNIDFSEVFGNNLGELEQMRPIENVRSPKISEANDEETKTAVSSEMPHVTTQNFNIASTTEVRPRYCTSASQCNSALNERCITVGSSSVCGCAKVYVRHKETNKCVVKRVVEASLQLPAEKFDEDLKNPFSPRYKQMEEKANNTLWLALRNKPELLSIIAEVEITGFSEGSLIVKGNLIFAVETNSEAELIKGVEKDLKKALGDKQLIEKSALDISNATVVAYPSEINPCSSSELNYCSENAYCLVSTAVPERFVCRCKEHYRDVSSNPQYLGETCIDKCPPDYCGPNGHCEILANDQRHCICDGLYFGRRCEVPGMLVLAILAVLASVSVIFAIVVACRKRCGTVSYGGPQNFRRSEEVGIRTQGNDRVSDAIALEENIGSKITKFITISTPVQVPVIRITRPTSHESNVSFDGDSTFDSTNMDKATPTGVNKTENSTV